MSNEKSSNISSADLFEDLLENTFIEFSSEKFIEFISHKNHLVMSALLLAIQSEKEDLLNLLMKYITKIKTMIYMIYFSINILLIHIMKIIL